MRYIVVTDADVRSADWGSHLRSYRSATPSNHPAARDLKTRSAAISSYDTTWEPVKPKPGTIWPLDEHVIGEQSDCRGCNDGFIEFAVDHIPACSPWCRWIIHKDHCLICESLEEAQEMKRRLTI